MTNIGNHDDAHLAVVLGERHLVAVDVAAGEVVDGLGVLGALEGGLGIVGDESLLPDLDVLKKRGGEGGREMRKMI